MGIKTTEFGKTKDGKIVNLYTLTNKNGVSASFTDLGGTWVSMSALDLTVLQAMKIINRISVR